MRLVISGLHFPWETVSSSLLRARELGLDGVEFSWHNSFARPHCTRQDIADLDAIRDRHDATLTAHIWENLPQMGEDEAHLALRGWLALCKSTGTEGLVIHGGSWPDQREGIAITRHILEGVLGEFEEAGVVLNLENHYPYAYKECQELFSESWEFNEVLSLDSPSLRVCYDTGHANMTDTPFELLDNLGPALNYIHLADNMGVHDDHLKYNQGTVQWQEVFSRLQKAEFDGILCVEFGAHGDLAPFHECLRDMRKRWPELVR